MGLHGQLLSILVIQLAHELQEPPTQLEPVQPRPRPAKTPFN